MIKVTNLCAGYEKVEKLHNISCAVQKGCITVLIGPNGCGKSTLLKAICGVLPYENGEIEIDGQNMEELKGNLLAKKLAYLPQNRNIPAISAKRMVLHGRFPYLSYPRKYKKQDYDIANQAMEKTGILKHSDTLINKLSGGERQKVYLAMALAQNTPVVLLDEPTTFLDIYQQLDVLRMVKQLKQNGKTVIMVLHDLNLALQCADKIIVMQDGEIIKIDTPQAVAQSNVFQKVFNVDIEVYNNKQGDFGYFFKL